MLFPAVAVTAMTLAFLNIAFTSGMDAKSGRKSLPHWTMQSASSTYMNILLLLQHGDWNALNASGDKSIPGCPKMHWWVA